MEMKEQHVEHKQERQQKGIKGQNEWIIVL